MAKDRRTKEIARIKCLARDLELSDKDYRDLLWTQARVRSAADLDAHGRQKVIRALAGDRKPYPGRPRNTDVHPRLKKIEALLTDAGRPWSYGQALAKKIAHKDRLEFCDHEGLGKIIAALEYDARRRATAQESSLKGH